MDEQMKVSFVGDASSLEAASRQSTAALDNVTKSTSKVSAALAQSSAVMARGAGQMGGSIAKGANQANLAMVNLGRVLQDAPYGFLGISNNLNPLLESFQRLKAETGTSGAALKALTGSLLGGGGLGLALSAVTAVMQFATVGLSMWTRGMGSSNSAAEKTVEAIKNIKASFNSLAGIQSIELSKKINLEIAKGAADDAGPAIANIEKLQLALTNVTLKTGDRKKALEDYNKVAADANKLQETDLSNLDKVNTAINRQIELLKIRSLIKGAQDQLAAQFKTIFEAQFKTQTALEKANPSLKTFADLMGTAAADSKDFSTGLDFGQSLNASKQLGFNFFEIQKGARAAGGQVFNLINFIDGLIKQAEGLGGAFEGDKSNSKGDKSKFNFLFDFLPFDPSGKLKPEQQGQLNDAIDKFSKEFSGIFKGVNFAALSKSPQDKIKLALQFDADLKAGKVQFDLSKIREATDKAIKAGDVIPESTVGEIDATVVDKFIRGFQNAADTLNKKDFMGDLFQAEINIKQIKSVGEVGKKIGESLGNSFGDTFKGIFEKQFSDAISNGLKGQQLEDFKTELTAIGTVGATAAEGIADAFGKFGDELLRGKASMGSFAGALTSAFRSIGREIIKDIALAAILSAIKAATGQGEAGFFKNFLSIVAGSHASGLYRVPKNGYIAELHKDEMVVPAKFANIFRGFTTPTFSQLSFQSMGAVSTPTAKQIDRSSGLIGGGVLDVNISGQFVQRGKDMVATITKTQKIQKGFT